MSLRIVRTRSGEDVICDIQEITQPDSEKILGYQLIHPYVVYISQPMVAEDDDGNIHAISNPEITMEMYAPLAKEQKIIVRFDEIISAYETHQDVLEKYGTLIAQYNQRENSNGQNSTTEERESE
tara:strand:+ start:465 stop:839 length:375 start_codon:yes stop_codon:yes gene_type:complete